MTFFAHGAISKKSKLNFKPKNSSIFHFEQVNEGWITTIFFKQTILKSSHILRRPQNFAKYPPHIWQLLHRTNLRWRFRKKFVAFSKHMNFMVLTFMLISILVRTINCKKRLILLFVLLLKIWKKPLSKVGYFSKIAENFTTTWLKRDYLIQNLAHDRLDLLFYARSFATLNCLEFWRSKK